MKKTPYYPVSPTCFSNSSAPQTRKHEAVETRRPLRPNFLSPPETSAWGCDMLLDGAGVKKRNNAQGCLESLDRRAKKKKEKKASIHADWRMRPGSSGRGVFHPIKQITRQPTIQGSSHFSPCHHAQVQF